MNRNGRPPLITVSDSGLYCAAGDFHIDPWRPVPRAIITHAHGDHLRAGSGEYLYAARGAGLIASRLPEGFQGQPLDYGETRDFGAARISLHPAGHILGSAQVRIAHGDQVWVVSGDYKRDPDPTCEPFEPQDCDVFISEATFALPVFRWPSATEVVAELKRWWDENRARGIASVVFCYALGKSQRLLAELAPLTDQPVYLHGALLELTGAYREAGVAMAQTIAVSLADNQDWAGRLIIAPPSAAGSAWMRRFGDHATAFCSGWMRVRGNRRRRGYDRGFVLSDHADWPSLLRTFAQIRPEKVLLTHGHTEAMTRYLNETGQPAEALATAFGGDD